MGSRAPAPRLLRLKPEDQSLLVGAPLRQGKFTWVTEAGREERWIVASCGNYPVLWNFRYHPDCCSQTAFHCQYSQVVLMVMLDLLSKPLSKLNERDQMCR